MEIIEAGWAIMDVDVNAACFSKHVFFKLQIFQRIGVDLDIHLQMKQQAPGECLRVIV